MSAKGTLKRLLGGLGLEVHRRGARPAPGSIPDADLYDPKFSPWNAERGPAHELFALAKPFTLLPVDRLFVLATLAAQACALDGELWECGVYRGGTARLIAEVARRERAGREGAVRLFDTFEGMPETDRERDLHRPGDFANTSLEAVRARLASWPFAVFHPGVIPATFAGLEDKRIAFAHVDVDLYGAVRDCCAFLYPRLRPGGFLVFDDYGFASCPGARQAVDEFFQGRVERPLVLATGQAVVFRAAPANG